MLGEALRKNRRAEASLEFYQRALDQDAAKFVYYARLGGAYVQLGYADKALAVFRRGVERFPKLAEAHYFVGIAARARADYQLAEAELRASLGLQPGNADALAQLGFILGEQDRAMEAEKVLRGALAINSRHFYASYDLGRLLVKAKRYAEALRVLRNAATLKPQNPSVHYQLFLALSRLNQKEAAAAELLVFKQLEAERKAKPQADDETELENPEPSATPS
jgi:tetratricopeptide (TPR) repeat protein